MHHQQIPVRGAASIGASRRGCQRHRHPRHGHYAVSPLPLRGRAGRLRLSADLVFGKATPAAFRLLTPTNGRLLTTTHQTKEKP